MATQIILPKDAEGKEVPLDTETLYDEHGEPRYVKKFSYNPNGKTTDSKWTIEYVSGVSKFVSQMYLTQPDSWKKLADDLDRCIKDNTICMYYCPVQKANCSMCAKPGGRDTYECTSLVFNDIKKRIRKLRGES